MNIQPPSSPFALLKLPYVVLKEVILNMEPFQQINYTFCSKRSKLIMKQLMPKDSYKIIFWMKKKFLISLCGSKEFEFSSIEMENRRKFLNPKGCRSVQLMKWADYLCDIFNTSIHSLRVCSDYRLDDLNLFVNWITKRQESLEYCELNERFPDWKAYSFLFENLKVKNMNDGTCLMSTFDNIAPLTHTKVFMSMSYWFTLDHLLAASCTKIELGYANLRSADMNVFLKEWMRGSLPNLEYFVTRILDHDIQTVFDGVMVTRTAERGIKHKYEGIFKGLELIAGGKQVRRNDGIVATVDCSDSPSMSNAAYVGGVEEMETIFKLIVNSLFLTEAECVGKELNRKMSDLERLYGPRAEFLQRRMQRN